MLPPPEVNGKYRTKRSLGWNRMTIGFWMDMSITRNMAVGGSGVSRSQKSLAMSGSLLTCPVLGDEDGRMPVILMPCGDAAVSKRVGGARGCLCHVHLRPRSDLAGFSAGRT